MAEPPLALPPLREVIARFGLRPRKALGQNFLLDPRVLERIARAAGDLDRVTVIEIGAGPGGLTRALLAHGARQVIAVERDPRCVAALHELAAHFPGRLQVIEADALTLDLAALAPPPRKIVANLPYNVATPLLIRWLGQARAFRSMTLMFQREVALRLLAQPGSADYGRLTVLAQWRCRIERLFDLPPRAFTPPPKVVSTLVRLTPLSEPLAPADPRALETVVKAAFGQRRKMLRSSLKTLGVDAEALCAAAGLDPTARAETVSVEGFCALARAWRGLWPKSVASRAAAG